MKAIICGALMALFFTTAHAAEEDLSKANDLLPYCKLTREQAASSIRNASNFGRCIGVVEGVSQTFILLKEAQAAGVAQLDPLLCMSIPSGVTARELVNVVVRYAEAFPELTQRPFTVLVTSALRVAWPCKN